MITAPTMTRRHLPRASPSSPRSRRLGMQPTRLATTGQTPHNDAEVVVAAMTAGPPLCVRCLVTKTGIPRDRVERGLRASAGVVTVRTRAICHACLDGGTVFRLA